MKRCIEFPSKRRYNTQREAETAISLLDTSGIRAYHCRMCRGWHLTSRQSV
jgi:hypothetical protein